MIVHLDVKRPAERRGCDPGGLTEPRVRYRRR